MASSLHRRARAQIARTVRRRALSEPAEGQPVAAGEPQDPFLELASNRETWVDPFPLYAAIQTKGAIYAPAPDLFVISGYDEVTDAMKEDRFRAEPQDVESTERLTTCPSIAKTDAPRHTELRRMMAKWFTPRQVEKLAGSLAEHCEQLLADALKRGSFDVVQDYALPLSVQVIATILGIPEHYYPRFRELSDVVGRGYEPFLSGGEQADLDAALVEILEYLDHLYGERRRQPGDDLLTALLNAGDDATRLSNDELLVNAAFILAAGYLTTAGMIGSGMNILLDHPDVWQEMRDNDVLIANIVEEVTRLESPVQLVNRRTTVGFDFCGVHIPAESRVLLLIAAANRDPQVFADPHRFNPWRDNASRHVAFTVGAHHCLGSSLARMEGLVAFRTLANHFPDIQRAGPAIRRPNLITRGFTHVPIAIGHAASVR